MEIALSFFPIIATFFLCIAIIFLMQEKPRKKKILSLLKCGLVGFCITGAIGLFTLHPDSVSTLLFLGLSGALFGESLLLSYEVVRKINKQEISPFYDDGTPPKFYITGDKHRNFDSVELFCKDMKTRKKDVLIVLGDAGFNYYGDRRDKQLKERAQNMNITFFCIHGNKENRPANIETYGKRNFCGGKVYFEPKYPNILFAMDGEIYNFEGKEYFVMGGAHSIDKNRCLEKGLPYWEDEMPTKALMLYAEKVLEKRAYKVHGVLTHTCPFQYRPREMFETNRRSEKFEKAPKLIKLFKRKPFELDIDHSTEYMLEDLEKKLQYKAWFCGHYHVDKPIDKITMLFREIRPLNKRNNNY